MYVNYEYYRIFYFVAKYSNFTKAAKALDSNQPNVTRAMNQLENQLNCKLFNRTNRGVNLTAEGQFLYTHVKAAMLHFQTAENEIESLSEPDTGIVNLSATETALSILMLRKLKAFHAAHPGIHLKIQNHTTIHAVSVVRSGEVDFAAVTTPVSVAAPLKLIKLTEFQEILVGGKSFSPEAVREMSLAEAATHPLIGLDASTATNHFYHEFFRKCGLNYDLDTVAATRDQIASLVKCDLGLAFLPEPMIQDSITRGEVVQLKLKEPVPVRQVCIVYDSRRPLNAAARLLLRLITEPETESTDAENM